MTGTQNLETYVILLGMFAQVIERDSIPLNHIPLVCIPLPSCTSSQMPTPVTPSGNFHVA